MRASDVEECRAFGLTPKQGLRQSLMASSIAYTAKVDGVPAAMLGVESVSLVEGLGRPWMLGTEEVYRQGKALLELGPWIIGRMLDSSPELANVVSQTNGRAIRVLRRWGFEVGEEVQMIGGVPFLDFRMSR